jgi:exosortase
VLIYFARNTVFALVRPAVRAGLAVTAAGVALALVGRWSGPALGHSDALALSVAALAVMWLGGFLLFYGPTAFRAALFPLLFVAFMVPIPSLVLDGLIYLLRAGSADAVAGLFSLTGTLYYREGFVFALPSVVIEVADECSGIRSSIALVLTALLAGHMTLASWWKKAVLVAVAIPLTIVKNAIRIVTLSLLAIHVDPEFLTGQLHHDGGVLFFALTLAMMAPILALLRRSEPVRAEAPVQVETA